LRQNTRWRNNNSTAWSWADSLTSSRYCTRIFVALSNQ